MYENVYVFRNRDNSMDFVPAPNKQEAEEMLGKKSNGHFKVSNIFQPKEKNPLHLSAALDLAAEEYDDILDETTRAVIKIAASQIRESFFK